MNNRALAAEAFGTFMLMSAVLGSAFYSFGAPSGAAGILWDLLACRAHQRDIRG
jgi:aquaporin Z